ncbi:MAG: hypothetical protein ABNH38_16125 [Tateyamaria sp.]|jgi:hypothetical protein|uniref:hypothetical protein n=1 Tax=Tateyamaria sp. TaxID=1929288 RepID=UPI0032DD27E6
MKKTRRSGSERKLARQNAKLVYDRFCIDLSLLVPDVQTDTPAVSRFTKFLEPTGLPAIEVPLGDIAFHEHPERLPVIGVRMPDRYDPLCFSALTAFMSEHHIRPFFRPIFLLSGCELLPLLGRYGFAYHVLSSDNDEEEFGYLNLRYLMSSARDLLDTKLIWASAAK